MKLLDKGLVFVLVALASAQVASYRGCTWPDIPPVVTPDTPPVSPSTATAATYVYEKDQTAIPSAVLAGIDRINREKKIVATTFEQDTVDGDGQTPEQYKVPLAAAKEAGLPALVVTAKDKVLKVVKAPQTAEQIVEAIQ